MMQSAFLSWQDFWAMGGYAFYVWLAVVSTLLPLLILVLYTRWQHGNLLREVKRQQARERRMKAAQDKEAGRING